MTKAEIHLDGEGKGSVRLGDVDVSDYVHSLSLSATVGQATELTLGLTAARGADFVGDVIVSVEMTDALATALRAAGWTPPSPQGDARCSATLYNEQCERELGHDGSHESETERWRDE